MCKSDLTPLDQLSELPVLPDAIDSDSPYERIIELIPMLNPNISTIGTVLYSTEISGNTGAKSLAAHGQAAGLEVFHAPVNAISGLRHAIVGLYNRGINAFVLPVDSVAARGLPTISRLAATQRIPLLYGNAEAVFEGSTLGMGS